LRECCVDVRASDFPAHLLVSNVAPPSHGGAFFCYIDRMKNEPMNWLGLALILATIAVVAMSIRAFH
jgi:hypothetical protein